MILTEYQKDCVCFSDYMARYRKALHKELCDILTENRVPTATIANTKDYWCRDFMPVQYGYGKYVLFRYTPNYLRDLPDYQTNAEDTTCNMKGVDKEQWKRSRLVVDGGNVVFCHSYAKGQDYLVMTDKVMNENPSLSQEEIENLLRTDFENNKLIIVWLPWDRHDKCGHTDSILRQVGESDEGKPIVLTNLTVYGSKMAGEMRQRLEKHFEVKELQLSHYGKYSWAYINCLQTRKVIIVPAIGEEETDKEALNQIKSLYPQYKDRVYQVQMRNFIARGGGALNCCTWTVAKEKHTTAVK